MPSTPAFSACRALLLGLVLAFLAAPGLRAQTALQLDPAKALTQYGLDHWGTDDGLPQNMITAVARTADGRLWLGTQEGVVHFDGLRFTVFDKQSGAIGQNHVAALAAAPDGALWIGLLGGGLVRYDGAAFTALAEADGLVDDRVNALAVAPDGALWIGTEGGGLARYHDGRFTAFGEADGLPDLVVTSLAVAADGTVWAGFRQGLARRAPGGRFTPLPEFAGQKVTALVPEGAALWAGLEAGGLARVERGRVTRRLGPADGLASPKVLALARDPRGALWIGTGGGVARLADGRLDTLTTAHGLVHDDVKTLLADGAGSVWLGTEAGGLHRLRAGKFTPFGPAEGLSYNHATVVLEDRTGAVWTGTFGGGLSRIVDGRAAAVSAADGFTGRYVLGLAETRDGSVWIGTHDAGLFRYRDGRFTPFTAADGLPNETIWGLYADRDDALWISTDAGLARLADGRFTLFTEADGLASTSIAAIEQDAAGDLWLGVYDGGLHRMRDGRVVAHLDEEDGLGSNTVVALYADPEGPLWIGTSDGGLSRLHEGRLVTVTTEHGLPEDKVFRILEDGDRHLWLTSNQGVVRIAKDVLNDFAEGRRPDVVAVVYDEADGLRSAEFTGGAQPAGWRGRDGRLWLPGVQGVAVIDPARIPLDLTPPRVVIDAFIAGDAPRPLRGAALAVAPGPRRFEFHYAALVFHAPEEVTYEYRLEGVDDGWVPAGTRREAFYTNLAPGPYTFHVRARNADGLWSPRPATASFYLQPFFWQTGWFRALVLVGAALLLFAGYRLRVRHLQARQRELEHLVDERTRDLSEAKDRIEAQADQLRELDRIKTRFFSNISHEFRTPLTLNIGPLENALTGLYGPLSEPLQKQLSIMLRNARRLLRLINQLLDLSKLESGKMTIRRQVSDLAGFVEGIVLSFTAFAERKRLDLQFEAAASPPVAFDPECMEKVFFNLLSNAVKFTPEGGRITVALEPAPAGALPGGAPAVVARVTDTGQGIPARDLPYIFDRFHQVDGSVSDVQEGTGIGLSLVKELVELHGGTIAVSSEPGVGTTFVLTLPLAEAAAEAAAEAGPSWDNAPGSDADQAGDGFAADGLAADAPAVLAPLPTVVSRGPMVEMAVFDDEDAAPADAAPGRADDDRPVLLVVDDNQDIRDYMVSCLRDRYRVRTAPDGQAALDAVRADAPDLVISDVMMPRLSGYALCAAIKEDAALRHVPVVLLTAKASVDEKVEGLEAGADDYLTKPFNARELLARVDNLLALRRHQRQLQALNGELGEANEALRAASELKSQFLRIAAHDLRTPLNSIQGFADLAREEVPDEADGAHELLDLILNNARRMADLITQILEAEALESGAMELDRERLDLAAFVRDAAAHHAAAAARKDQPLLADAPADEALWVDASPVWLREAFDNLVSNAIKYSPVGGAIRLEAGRVGAGVQLRVRDEGPGILEADRPRLFKKFQKLTARPTGGEASTGLGLSIVKQIIEAHGGRVWADSEPGQGSTFVIELTAADAAPDERAAPSGAPALPAAR